MPSSFRALLVVIACGAAVTAAGAQKKVDPKKAAERVTIEKTLLAGEQKILDALVKGDVGTFKSLVETDAWSVDANGLMSAPDFEKQLQQGAAKITESHLTFAKVLWIDGDNAVVTYTWTGKGTFMNQPVPSPVYASTLWTKRSGKWIAVFHQETPAAKK